MTIEEIRKTREKTSLKLSKMPIAEQREYIKKGADALEKMMNERKQEKANAKKEEELKKVANS